MGVCKKNEDKECSGHGDCIGGSCDCDSLYSGDACEVKKTCPSPSSGLECGGEKQGICNYTGTPSCMCRDDWAGNDCSTPIIKENLNSVIEVALVWGFDAEKFPVEKIDSLCGE